MNAVRCAIGDTGEDQRFIRTLLCKGVRFVGIVHEGPGLESQVSAGASKEHAALPLPDRPSIAVLPFVNMSGDPQQDYFADGMLEEIITALSRLRWLFVIARNSSLTYKGRAIDVREVGRELGVRYVLEGSVRKSANQVRITGQLIDASSGAHIWADRFDGAINDIFDLQDQVTASVVGAIAPEIERASRKPTENLDAYDYYLQGMAKLYQATKEANGNALRLFYKAVQLDPNFASAYGMAAWCYTLAQAEWVDGRPRQGGCRNCSAGRASGGIRQEGRGRAQHGWVCARIRGWRGRRWSRFHRPGSRPQSELGSGLAVEWLGQLVAG